MNRILAVALVILAVSTSRADDISGSERLLCSTSRIMACFETGDCAELLAEELDVPQFVVVDTRKKRLTTTKASGENRSTAIGEINRADGLLFFQGIEGGRAFSFVVHEHTGHLTVAVSRDGLSVSVFGSCTDVTDADI
ncbi:MAG TPA: hypothetical protein VFY27_07110 [Woeseiaceae bacterium]|nr:hypothetical protein [Woeseiaceae bacterium]